MIILFLIERFPLISLIGICSYFLQPIRISCWTRAWPFFDNVTQPIQFSIDFRQLLAARKRKRWSGDVTFKKDLAGSDQWMEMAHKNQTPPEKFESLQYQSFQFFSIIKYHHKQTSLIINQFVCFFLLCFSVVRNSFDTSTRRPLSPFSIGGCWSKVMANHCYGRVAKSSGTQV